MRAMVYMAYRNKVDVDAHHKGIQYALKKLVKSKFVFERTAVPNFKSKRHEGSGNEIVDYSRAPCVGADQKARGLWERDLERIVPQGEQGHPQTNRDLSSSQTNNVGVTSFK